MKNAKLLPTIMIGLQAISMIVYAFKGDVRRTLYWFGAALITLVVTY